MARAHRLSLLISLLFLAAAAAPGGKVKISMRPADEEEARWLDRAVASGAAVQLRPGGTTSFSLRRATEEEARWLDRLAGVSKRRESHGDDGDDYQYVEYDDDDDFGRAVETLFSRLSKLADDVEKSHVENDKLITKFSSHDGIPDNDK